VAQSSEKEGHHPLSYPRHNKYTVTHTSVAAFDKTQCLFCYPEKPDDPESQTAGEKLTRQEWW
jgi:hypothetical protein